jgi:alpha-tubulin suppressor-like RCC1 family protein
MPNFSAKWGLMEQLQAVAAGTWTGLPTGELYAWGYNVNGQLGFGDVERRSSPVQVGSLTTWSKVSAGRNFSLALSNDGYAYGWGLNSSGQLGNSTTVNSSSPVQIGSLNTWGDIQAGGVHGLAIKTDGTLWSWGNNSRGSIGDNTTIYKSSPVQVGALTNWAQISASVYSSASIKTDGTLWTWGSNSNGGLGDGTTASRSSPIQVGALTDWAQVSLHPTASDTFCIAVKTDGTLWSWGRNSNGQLGRGNIIELSSPAQVGALTNWLKPSTGASHVIALKTDGTLWSWGRNFNGQLGQGNTIDRSSPVQVGALTNWSIKLGTGDNLSSAIKADGTLWAWGNNFAGGLGDNNVVFRSSPVQIGALTAWSQVSGGNGFTTAIFQGSSN